MRPLASSPAKTGVSPSVDVRAGRMLCEHGIEIGGGLAGAPPMWRIGLMGVNADRAVADRVLEAMDTVLAEEPAFATSA